MANMELFESWVPQACTLPSAEQPLRLAEFDDLFATAVRSIDRPEPDQLVLVLDAGSESSARDLAERENGCCAFFDFSFSAAADGEIRITVGVPASHTDVLDALAERAIVADGTDAL